MDLIILDDVMEFKTCLETGQYYTGMM